MRLGNKSICIVASTLPADFMASQVDALDIDKIVVMSRNLERSYSVFKVKYPTIKLVCAPRGFMVQPLYLFGQLFWAKLRGHSVVFFHECCLPLLDLLLMLIKPSGLYLPQVTMYGFNEISHEEFPKHSYFRLIVILGLVEYFRFYKAPSIGGGPSEYAISVKGYPEKINAKDVAFSRKIISESNERFNRVSVTRKILFVAGKSFIADEYLISYYSILINIAHSRGYICLIKDHPNPIYRLNLYADCATSYDPLVPSELLDRDFYLVVGVSSTSLLAYGERSVSLLKLMPEMTSEDRVLCIDHFEKAAPGNKIKYIESIDDFEKLL